MKSKFLLFCLLLVVAWCKDSNEPGDETPTFANVDELMRYYGKLPDAPPIQAQKKKIAENQLQELNSSDRNYYESKETEYELTRGFDEIINLNSNNAETLYPGSIVQGKDLAKGLLSPISYAHARRPITLNMNNGGGYIDSVENSLSRVSSAVNELVAQKKPVATSITYQYKEIYSAEQAMSELGANIGWGPFSLGVSTNENDKYTRRSIFLYFKQTYYTIAMDGQDCIASKVFGDNVNLIDLQNETGQGNPLCVVSSVDYGRIIVVKVTSEDSYEDMIKNINGSFLPIDGSYEMIETSAISNYEYTAQVFGGTADDGVRVVNGISGVMQAINSGANYTKGSPGYPISFQVRHLVDGSLARTSQQCSYSETNWGLLTLRFNVQFHEIELNNTYIGENHIQPSCGFGVGNEKSSTHYWFNSVSYTSDDYFLGELIGLNGNPDVIISPVSETTKLVIYCNLDDPDFIDEDVSSLAFEYRVEDLIKLANEGILEEYKYMLTPYNTEGQNILHYTIKKL